MFGDIGKMLQQAREAQAEIAKLQSRLKEIEVSGTAGAGMVTATADCSGRLRTLTIDPALRSEKPEVAEDLIVAAVNDALGKAAARAQEEMANMTGSLKLPPMLANALK